MSEGGACKQKESVASSLWQSTEGRAVHRAIKSWDAEPAAHYLSKKKYKLKNSTSFQFMSLNLIWIGHILQEVPLQFDWKKINR